MTNDRKQAGSQIETDVLIVGGGPAGGWAALAAAGAGARVVLADKGYHGTSGATAPSNTGTWCVPPGEARAEAVERRWQRTHGLADRRWMHRTVDQAYANLLQLVEWGYAFPRDDQGNLYIANLRGPDYMHFLRRKVKAAGVTILDHHPALELLTDGDVVTGAAGLSRRTGDDWHVHAGAVVLATGGCAFFERLMGGGGLTGDGYLMAAEAGAALSGMEFTGKYTLAPFDSSLNKGLPYRWASFHRQDGTPILDSRGRPLTNGIGGTDHELARALLDGPVFARLDLAEPAMQDWLRRGQPNCFLPYDRRGIDPFTQLFRVNLTAEGTVRGTGGIRLTGDDCATDVPGLYAAGDAASRENVTGASSGGGAVNASWAMASGWFAGAGAARHARQRGTRRAVGLALGQAGLRPAAAARPVDHAALVEAVRAETIPLDRNFFRTGNGLAAGRERLEGVWAEIRDHLSAQGAERLRVREIAAVAASARWSLAAAEARGESRGVHRRADLPETDAAWTRRLIVSGLDQVEVSPDFTAAQAQERAS